MCLHEWPESGPEGRTDDAAGIGGEQHRTLRHREDIFAISIEHEHARPRSAGDQTNIVIGLRGLRGDAGAGIDLENSPVFQDFDRGSALRPRPSPNPTNIGNSRIFGLMAQIVRDKPDLISVAASPIRMVRARATCLWAGGYGASWMELT